MNKELNVKVGDIVLYYYGNPWSEKHPVITKVAKITPTGRIRVERSIEEQFDKYGKKMGCYGGWSRPYLEVPTDERLQELKEKNFINNVIQKMHDVKNISYEQAVAIDEILEGGVSNE